MNLAPWIETLAGRQLVGGTCSSLFRRVVERPFAEEASRKVLIYYSPNRISFSQVFPFLNLTTEFRFSFNASIRLLPISDFLSGSEPPTGPADIILVQPWFTEDPAILEKAFERQLKRQPNVPISFLDSYAHSDLRLARHIAPYIKYYLKKSVFLDSESYYKQHLGDTNLTEYYSNLYGLAAEPVDWEVPRGFVDRVRLSPNFITDPSLEKKLMTRRPDFDGERPIDVHARIGVQGTGWYSMMRKDAISRVGAMTNLVVTPRETVSRTKYDLELRASTLCFSPFGYGELCWRDIEAIQAGSVLIKPSMDHLRTLPDLYEPGVTYLPVQWDFADLEDVVRNALANKDICRSIATEAFERARRYLETKQFVRDMAFLFEGSAASPLQAGAAFV